MLSLRASSPIGRFVCARDDAAVLPLLLVHFNIMLYAMSYWITQPVLPFLSKKLGADAIIFGQLQTFFSVVQLVGNPMIGRLSDVHGAKLALQVCQLSTALSYFLLSSAADVPQIFLSRLPTVLMQSMHCAQALVTELSPKDERRTLALGRLSISYGLGMTAGPVIGGALAHYITYQSTAAFAGCIILLPVLVNARCLPNSNEASKQATQVEASKGKGLKLKQIFHVLSIPSCRTLTIFMMLTGLGGSIYESTFGMAASSTFSFDPKLLGLLQTTAAVLGLFTNSFFVGFLERRLGAHRLMASAAATLAALALLYSQAEGQGEVAGSKRFGLHTTWYVFGIASSMSLPSACIYTSITSLLSKASDSDNTATVIGLGHAARSAVGIVGPSVGGFLLEKHGTAGVGFATAAVMSCAGVFLLLAKASLQGVQGVDNDRAATHVTEKKKT